MAAVQRLTRDESSCRGTSQAGNQLRRGQEELAEALKECLDFGLERKLTVPVVPQNKAHIPKS